MKCLKYGKILRLRSRSRDFHFDGKCLSLEINTKFVKKKIKEAYRTFVSEAVKTLGDRLKSLVLYGSVARGKAGDESDIDIFAVVSDDKAKEVLFDISFEIGLRYGFLLSVVTRTEEEEKEMERIGSIYLKEIRRTGEVLYA